MTTITILILYLIGVASVFAFLTFYKKAEYEIAIFGSIFYPVILLTWLLVFLLTMCALLIFWIVDAVKDLMWRFKNVK